MKTQIRELADRDRADDYALIRAIENKVWAHRHFAYERPMSKRIPSPYTTPEPPRVVKRDTDGAMVAFVSFVLIGVMASFVGLVTIGRWIMEAVR